MSNTEEAESEDSVEDKFITMVEVTEVVKKAPSNRVSEVNNFTLRY